MYKKLSLSILFIMIFILSLNLNSTINIINWAAKAQGATYVKVDPQLIEYHTNATGQRFTIAVKITDVINLYGFDIKFRWNTTYLDYVSHSVRVPRDTYSDGVLWKPYWLLKNEVYANGTSWIAYCSYWPAPTFNGSGTFFTMTFRVKQHPVQKTVNLTLELHKTDLADPSASPIPHYKQNGKVILYALAPENHNIAVTNINSQKTIVGRGYTTNINVMVANQGDYIETFNVTLYANATAIGTKGITLQNGASTTVTFTWNTAGFAKGGYTIWAYAWPVQDETDTKDNTLIDGYIIIVMPGDINNDGIVDYMDISPICRLFGKIPSDPHWNPNCDIIEDGIIDYMDIGIPCRNYGKTDP